MPRLLLFAALALFVPTLSLAQQPPAAPPEDDPDLDINFAQPDFSLVNLPTTLRVPRFKSAFRVTHRFGRPLGAGSVGSLFDDLFGLDAGAQIGLEYRFGIARGWQLGIHRTSGGKTIEFFTQYNLMQQGESRPLGLGVIASIEGTNNFHDSEDRGIESIRTPALGLIVSRELGRNGTLYFEPIWVNNSNPLPDALVDENDTFIAAIGARLRLRPTVYVVAEFLPRVGFDPGVNHGTFGIEKRAGGHSFQLNFSNGFGTTMGQLARGGTAGDDWYLGFNISRKFY
jgi:hypothetical protein